MANGFGILAQRLAGFGELAQLPDLFQPPGHHAPIAQAVAASSTGYLTVAYSGTTAGTATTTSTALGSTMTGWKAGMMVPFARRGRIWVAGDASGTALDYGAINVWHSSTGTHPQGVFTLQTVSPVSGSEIDIAPHCVIYNPGSGYANQYTDPLGNVMSVYPVDIHI